MNRITPLTLSVGLALAASTAAAETQTITGVLTEMPTLYHLTVGGHTVRLENLARTSDVASIHIEPWMTAALLREEVECQAQPDMLLNDFVGTCRHAEYADVGDYVSMLANDNARNCPGRVNTYLAVVKVDRNGILPHGSECLTAKTRERLGITSSPD